MKQTTALAAAFLMGGGMLLAQTTGTAGPGTSTNRDQSKGDYTKKMSAEVVSTDSAAKTITVRNLPRGDKDRSNAPAGTASGSGSGTTSEAMGMPEQTLRLEGKAADKLNSFKAGDKVMLTCKTNASKTGGTTTPTPNPGGTTTRTDPTIPPSPETDRPASPSGSSTSPDMSGGAMGSLQACQSVTEIKKSGS